MDRDTSTVVDFPSSGTDLPNPRNILNDALAATRDRERNYGPPKEHFARTVGLINAYLGDRLRAPLTVQDWPVIMILDKLARLGGPGADRDNLVDVAGYARCRETL